MSPNINEPITATIGEFTRLTGLGRSTIYSLIGAQRLDSFRIGKRRLIVLASYGRLIEQQRAAAPENGRDALSAKPAGTQAASPLRRRGRLRKADEETGNSEAKKGQQPAPRTAGLLRGLDRAGDQPAQSKSPT
jgi:hypothetical protein